MAKPKERTATATATATATKKKRFVKRLMSKEAWRWRFLGSSGIPWKRLNLRISFIDDLLFKFVSVFEAIVLVSTLCFFYCFCGCHF